MLKFCDRDYNPLKERDGLGNSENVKITVYDCVLDIYLDDDFVVREGGGKGKGAGREGGRGVGVGVGVGGGNILDGISQEGSPLKTIMKFRDGSPGKRG